MSVSDWGNICHLLVIGSVEDGKSERVFSFCYVKTRTEEMGNFPAYKAYSKGVKQSKYINHLPQVV
jgi:hypothetical protein